MARIIFANRFYWPDLPATGQLLTDLALHFASQGHEVTVIASGSAERPRVELHNGVTVQRIRRRSRSSHGVAAKLFDFVSFMTAALWHLARRLRRGDVVVCMTDPPLFGVAVGLLGRARGAKCIHWVQDVYPEIAVAVSGNRFLAVLRPLRNRMWTKADHCVAVSADIAHLVRTAGTTPENVTTIPNWAPHGLDTATTRADRVRELRREWNVQDKFIVAYSGNLGRVHALSIILDAADELRDANHIAIVFIGAGPQRDELVSRAAQRGLQNVHFIRPQSRDGLADSLSVADVHLVTLRSGCENYVFPSKLYGIAAVGRPVIAVAAPQSELARLVAQEAIGLVVAPDAPRQLAAAIRTIAQDRAQLHRFAIASTRFGERSNASFSLEKWTAVLQKLTGIPGCDTPLQSDT